MNRKMDIIEVDQTTAEKLKTRAAERGMSVSDLLAEIASASGPISAEPEDLAELDRRWAKVEAGDATSSQEDVVRWMETWGTPAFKPWRLR